VTVAGGVLTTCTAGSACSTAAAPRSSRAVAIRSCKVRSRAERAASSGEDAAATPAVGSPAWSRRVGEGGTGLGLAIVNRLVTSDGGGVELAEAPGGGLEAVVRLPLATAGTGATQPAPAVSRG
jgi:hypothetical protein